MTDERNRPPLVCRVGLHRWAPVLADGIVRCIRDRCPAVKTDLAMTDDVTLDGDYWVKVTSHDGVILYDGPAPVPEGIGSLTADDLHARRFNHYEFTAIELDESSGADA